MQLQRQRLWPFGHASKLDYNIIYLCNASSVEEKYLRLSSLLSATKDVTWLGHKAFVISATKITRPRPGTPLMLPGVWQVKKPELWKSLKFLGNMWTRVYFSAQAARLEGCQDAALSFSQLRKRVDSVSEGEPGGRWGRWKSDGKGGVLMSGAEDRVMKGRWKWLKEGKWGDEGMNGWMEGHKRGGGETDTLYWMPNKESDKWTLRFQWAVHEED